MRKLLKSALSLGVCLMLIFGCFMFSANAAANTSIAFSTSSPKVGDKVTVTIRANAPEGMVAFEAYVTYDASVLQFVSGSAEAAGTGKVRIVESPSNTTTASYSITFKTLKAGSSTIAVSSPQYVGSSLTKVPLSGCSAKLTVKSATTTPSSKPQTSSTPSSTTKSNNANLSALSIGVGALDPAFSGNTTTYSVIVENSVAAINITATPAHNKASVSGAGEKQLQVGDNKFLINVTAQDGTTKKTYTLNVRRATVEESINLNPNLVIINGEMHHINSDLSGVSIPAGFTVDKATYNGAEVDVLKSESGEYTLFMITRDQGPYTDYFVYKEHRDEFVLLNYITVNDTMYIFADLPENYTIPEGYYETATTLGNGTVKAFCSSKAALSDFYIIYCYANGEEGFYRLDTLDTSIQRAPDFSLSESDNSTAAGKTFNPIVIFKNFNMTEKIMCCTIGGLIILNLILVIILAVKSRKLKKMRYRDPLSDEDMLDIFNTASFPTPEVTVEQALDGDNPPQE